jgi:hypothetical protein
MAEGKQGVCQGECWQLAGFWALKWQALESESGDGISFLYILQLQSAGISGTIHGLINDTERNLLLDRVVDAEQSDYIRLMF